MAAICVDVGTTLIKVVAFAEDGHELGASRQATEIMRPKPGYSEQDMAAVWLAVVAAIRTVLAKVHERIEFLSLTAQGDGCWLVNRHGEPAGAAILWNDSRAKSVVQRWETSGVIEQAYDRNGSRHFSGLPHAILAWLQESDSQRLLGAHKSLYCGGWVFLKMTGEFATEESDASAPFFDIRKRAYSRELLSLYGLEWAEHLLPDVLPHDGRVRPLGTPAATELGLDAGTPVVMSSYDVASTALGAGVVAAGQACSVLGTTLCTEVLRDSVDTTGRAAGLCVAYNVPGTYLRAFPTLAGTEVFCWMQRLMNVSHPSDFGRMSRDIAPGSDGMLFLPYLSPAGERNPFYHPGARGTFSGLSFEHGAEHVAKAVLEGLSFVIRECLEEAKASPRELHLCGGAARDEIWCQMIADVTGLPATRTADSEVGARGAFIQGTVSTGMQGSFRQAARDYVKTERTFEPDPKRVPRYDEIYARFIRIRNATIETWDQL